MFPNKPAHTARIDARDRGLRRVRTATGWVTFAATTSAVVLAGGYAAALPGTSGSRGATTPGRPAASASGSSGRTAPAPSASRATASAQSASPRDTGAAATTITAAPRPPAPSSAPPQTTSGGS